jgi:hypothetical protein
MPCAPTVWFNYLENAVNRQVEINIIMLRLVNMLQILTNAN